MTEEKQSQKEWLPPTAIRQRIIDAAILFAETGEEKYAERIRHFVKLLRDCVKPSQFSVTKHASIQYRRRHRNGVSFEDASAAIHSMLGNAIEVTLDPQYNVVNLMAHDYKKARYFKSGDWVFVVVDNSVVTCHHGEADRWVEKG